MQFDTLKQEQEFDHYAAEFLLTKRNPSAADMALVMQRAFDNLNGAPASVSAFERAYRELYASGAVALVTEKLVEPIVQVRQRLTAEEYHAMPASLATRKYSNDRQFKSDVDALVAARKI
jgi:hypothetical protein